MNKILTQETVQWTIRRTNIFIYNFYLYNENENDIDTGKILKCYAIKNKKSNIAIKF